MVINGHVIHMMFAMGHSCKMGLTGMWQLRPTLTLSAVGDQELRNQQQLIDPVATQLHNAAPLSTFHCIHLQH